MIALDLTLMTLYTEMEIEYWAIKYSIAIFLFIPKSPHDPSGPSPLYIRVFVYKEV
jgi:hypothetical protein